MAKKKKSYRRKGGGKASTKMLLDGIIAGVAPGIVQRFAGNILGDFTGGVSLAAVGHFRKNPTLMTLAGVEFGQALGGSIGGAATGGGIFER